MRLLAEDLLLLALDDEIGRVDQRMFALPRALAAAVIADLVLAGRITLGRKSVAARDVRPMDDAVLDGAMAMIVTAKKPRSAEQWVAALRSKRPSLRTQIQDRLVAQGVLRREQRRVLLAIPATRFPMVQGEREAALRDQVRAVVLDRRAFDARLFTLLGLLRRYGTLSLVFNSEEREIAEQRLERITRCESMASSTEAGRSERDARSNAGMALGAAGGVVDAADLTAGVVDGWGEIGSLFGR